MAFMRMPCRAHSTARHLVMETTAALVAQYAVRSAEWDTPHIDEVLMITPPC
ncbi:hypothetical protein D3C75_1268060 [compost metagenome]